MRFILYISFVLFLAPDVYLIGAFLKKKPLIWRILFLLPTILGVLSVIVLLFNVKANFIITVFMVMLVCFALPKLLLVFFLLIAKLLGLWSKTASSIVKVIGILMACIVVVIGIYGLAFGWKKLETVYVDLYFDSLPESFDGYRIAHLSDLHLGTYGDETDFVEKIVRCVNEEHPDMIVFTGDIVNRRLAELNPFVPILSQLSAPDGVISVLGNHDYCLYDNRKNWPDVFEGSRMVAAAERSMGWEALLNESVIVNRGEDRIAVAGVGYSGKSSLLQNTDIKAAVSGVTDYGSNKSVDDIFTILLLHDPSRWRLEVLPKTHIPLTLSGHTHGAQFKIGKWSPMCWMYKEWGGLYQLDNQQIYVSEGLGGMMPFRFGSVPQVIMLTLHCK